MPGLLRKDATCPECGEPLLAISDISSTYIISREYAHQKPAGRRRRRRCVKTFLGAEQCEYARRERYELEVHR